VAAADKVSSGSGGSKLADAQSTARDFSLQTLGGIVSSNPYYVTALAGRYAKLGVGPERSANMVPHGDVLKAKGSLSFHSDMPMAPAKPLQLVWAAVNRNTAEGPVMGPEHRVPLDAALRAITIEAAYSIPQEKRIGSIEVGKDANLSILEQSRYEVAPAKVAAPGQGPVAAATVERTPVAVHPAPATTAASPDEARAALRRRTLLAASRREADLGLCSSDAEWRSGLSTLVAAQIASPSSR